MLFNIFCIISLIIVITFWPGFTGAPSCTFVVEGKTYKDITHFSTDYNVLTFYTEDTKVVADSYTQTCY